MTPRNVIIIGSGKRVREAALPVLRRLEARLAVRGIFARTAKQIDVDGVTHEVGRFEDLRGEELADVDLVYLAVTKDAVPSVLARLTSCDVSRIDLLIDTPVVRFKHFAHVDALRRFRNVWVAEDCSALPWFDVVREAVDAGAIGDLRCALFFQSAYAYHAIATAKALLGSRRIRSGRREALSPHFGCRRLRFANGRTAIVYEPRDYSIGRLALLGTDGSISDYPHSARGNLLLEPLVEGDACVGFRCGDATSRLSDDEVQLLRGGDATASVTSRMDAMKRVGLLRLFEGIFAGRGAYPLDEALDDMVVDYHLEKLGWYYANPFTSSRSPLARFMLKSLTRR